MVPWTDKWHKVIFLDKKKNNLR